MNDADEMARLMAAPWSQAFRVLPPTGSTCLGHCGLLRGGARQQVETTEEGPRCELSPGRTLGCVFAVILKSATPWMLRRNVKWN